MSAAIRGPAGYVLAGGNSSRMGRDKALLPAGGVTLIQTVAQSVENATGTVTIVGDPAKYAHLGYRVIPDLRPHQGPLSGLEAALTDTSAEWNLVLACDLAFLHADFLASLLNRIPHLSDEVDCLIPRLPEGRLQPLSAAYRRRCLPAFSLALDRQERRLLDTTERLHTAYLDVAQEHVFQNVNTPAEWKRYINERITRQSTPERTGRHGAAGRISPLP